MGIFLKNTIDRSIAAAKSGGIIQVGNSETAGDGVGVEDGGAVGLDVGVDVEIGFVIVSCIGVVCIP